MDIIGTVVNVAHITRRVVELIQGAHDAPTERKRVVTALFAASGVIETFRVLLESNHDASWKNSIAELFGPQGALTQYRSLLEQILDKASSQSSHKINLLNKLDDGWKTARWSFEKKYVEALVQEIGEIKSSLNFVLSQVQLDLGREMLMGLGSVGRKVESVILQQEEIISNQKLQLHATYQSNFRELCDWLSSVNVERQLKGSLRSFDYSKPSWYLDDDNFKTWEAGTAKSSVLWCPGLPGAGKTILASFLINDLRERHTENGSGVAIFFCNYKRQMSDEQTTSSIIRSVCRQLLEQHSTLRTFVEEFRSGNPSLMRREGEKIIVDEKQLLKRIISHLRTTFVLIDAWDELEHRQKTELRSYFNELESQSATTRLLVTSRHSERHLFSEAQSMEIVAKDDDVETFLRLRIKNIDPLSALGELSSDELTATLQKVIHQSSGLFLVAKGHMDTLEDCERKSMLRQKIGELAPHANLAKIYDDAWARIMEQKEDRRILGTSALLWVVRARRVLSCGELLHAVAASTSEWTDELDDGEVAREKDLVASCGGLIIINPDTTSVTIHRSLQEYFEHGRRSFYFPGANQDMARICLKYLSSAGFSAGHCSDIASWVDRSLEYPFLEYAAQNWGSHLREGGEETLLDSVLQLLRSPGHLACAAQALCRSPLRPMSSFQDWLAPYSNLNWFPATDTSVLPAVHLAAYFGLKIVLTTLLDENPSVNEKSHNGKTPIYIAVATGALASVKVLLDRGADVKAGCSKLITPLHIAVSMNDLDMVQLILNHDKGLAKEISNKPNFLSKSPLHDAVERSHLDVVKILLDVGADESAVDNKGCTSLHYSARQRDANIVKILLDKGADPLSADNYGNTPMHFASKNSHLDTMIYLYSCSRGGQRTLMCSNWKHKHMPIHEAAINGQVRAIKLLVKWGTPIDSRQWTGGTAFYQACEFGKPNTARALLELGADPTACDNSGRTGLHISSERNHITVMEMLVQREPCIPLLNMQDTKGRTVLLQIAQSAIDASLPHSTCSVRFRILLDAGADLNISDNIGCTVLHWAVRRTRVDLVNMVLESSDGRRLLDKTARDTKHTPLEEAVVIGHVQMIRRLVEVTESMQEEAQFDK